MPNWLLEVLDWKNKSFPEGRSVIVRLMDLTDILHVIKLAAEEGATKFSLAKTDEEEEKD